MDQPHFHPIRGQALALLALVLLVSCVEGGAAGGAQPNAEMMAASAATGVAAENIVAYTGTGAGMGGITLSGVPNILFYKAETTDKAQLKAAPARICAGSGVTSVEDKPLEHPEEMPGVRKLVVNCK